MQRRVRCLDLSADSQTFRLFQYTSRLLAWYFLKRGDAINADRFKGLQGGFSQARWGESDYDVALQRAADNRYETVWPCSVPPDCLEAFPTANVRSRCHCHVPLTDNSTSLSPAGQLAHVTAIVRQLSLGGFYTSEMFVWLGTVRGLRLDKT